MPQQKMWDLLVATAATVPRDRGRSRSRVCVCVCVCVCVYHKRFDEHHACRNVSKLGTSFFIPRRVMIPNLPAFFFETQILARSPAAAPTLDQRTTVAALLSLRAVLTVPARQGPPVHALPTSRLPQKLTRVPVPVGFGAPCARRFLSLAINLNGTPVDVDDSEGRDVNAAVHEWRLCFRT